MGAESPAWAPGDRGPNVTEMTRGRFGKLSIALVLGVASIVMAHSVTDTRLAVAADPTVALSASTGLVDGQTVDVSVSGMAHGITYLVVECGPAAITILSQHLPGGDINPEDGCEHQQNTVLFTADRTDATGSLTLRTVLDTAVGTVDCRVESCFVAFFALAGGGGIHLVNLSFAAGACDAPGSCGTGVQPGIAGRPAPAPADATPAPPVLATATAGAPVTVTRGAFVAGDLTPVGSVTGAVTGPFGQPTPPPTSVSGEGIVRLDLAAPGTDWGANAPSAVVADVTVDGGTAQQIVLFRGATPFVYAGGVGALSTGTHSVTIAVDAALSRTGTTTPTIDVHDVQLQVVTPDNSRYPAVLHAPIVFGRSTTALHDTPLLEYASSSTGGSTTHLGYTMVFSHENAGTAFVPFMESAVWGRMTDIESFFSLVAAADGTPSGATYFSGSTPVGYPDTLNAIDEQDVPFTGAWDGRHPLVRVATGNNDFSDVGTTAFRLRPVPVAPPPAGRPREAVMDANPWTYRVMGDEVARWYRNVTTDPLLPEQGDARQYASVEVSLSGPGITSMAVDLQLDGEPTWYASDFGGGYPMGGSGTSRTTVKLPTDWMQHTITAVRVRVFPASAAPTATVTGLRLFGLDQQWGFHELRVPAPNVTGGFLFTPVAPSVPPSSPPPTSPVTTAGNPPSVQAAGGSATVGQAPPATAMLARPTFTG